MSQDGVSFAYKDKVRSVSQDGVSFAHTDVGKERKPGVESFLPYETRLSPIYIQELP